MRPAQKGTQKEAIGRSRGGLSTKVHIAVDALGHPLRLMLTAGQVHESTQAHALVDGLPLISLIADKGYDSDAFRIHLCDAEVDAVIPPNGSRKTDIAYDENAYGLRYRIECLINKIKQSAHRNALREDGMQLLLDAVPRRRYDLAALNVNTT